MSIKDTIKSIGNRINDATSTLFKSARGVSFSMFSTSSDVKKSHPRDYDYYFIVYKINSDVAACVNKYANGCLGTGWDIVDNDQEQVNEEEHEKAYSFFENCNPHKTFDEILKELIQNYGISGDGYLEIAKNGFNEPTELWGLPSQKTFVKSDKHGEILGYKEEVDGDEVDFEPDEVLHLRRPNPIDNYYGLSPMASCMNEVECDLAALLSNYGFFINDATPSSVWQFAESMNDKDYQQIKKEIERNFKGTKNRHKSAIVKGEFKLHKINDRVEDAAFLAGRSLATEKVCASYAVQKFMIGYTDSANYNTSRTSERDFYQNTILPIQESIENLINKQILPAMGITTCKFKFKAADFTEREVELKEAQSGVLTYDEARAILGREALDPKYYGEKGRELYQPKPGKASDELSALSGGEQAKKNIADNLVNIKYKLQEIKNGKGRRK
jgi:HK97 family phage portal protein